jgi:hypothetical protein
MHKPDNSPNPPNLKRLNFIKRFLQSNQALMLIVGEKGSGKTRLLLDVVLQMRETRPIIRLQGNPKLSPSQLTQVLAKHWRIHHIDKKKRVENQLSDMLEGLIKNNQSCILSIDDAHLLSLPMLAALSHLVTQQQGKKTAHLHLLLSGRPVLAEKINNLIANDVPQLTIGALSREEAYRKIKSLLDKEKLSLPHAVANATFAKLYRRSGGMPATLERMVNQLTAQRPIVEPPTITQVNQPSTPTPINTPHKTHKKAGHRVKILSLSSVVVLSYFFWGWQHGAFNAKPKVMAWTQPTIELTHQNLAPIKKPIVTAPTTSEPVTPLLVSVPLQPYTLQLMSSTNSAALKKVIQAHHIADKAAVMKTQYQHHDWYVLTYGHYPDAQQARATISTLPDELQALHPWARAIKKLHPQ